MGKRKRQRSKKPKQRLPQKSQHSRRSRSRSRSSSRSRSQTPPNTGRHRPNLARRTATDPFQVGVGSTTPTPGRERDTNVLLHGSTLEDNAVNPPMFNDWLPQDPEFVKQNNDDEGEEDDQNPEDDDVHVDADVENDEQPEQPVAQNNDQNGGAEGAVANNDENAELTENDYRHGVAVVTRLKGPYYREQAEYYGEQARNIKKALKKKNNKK